MKKIVLALCFIFIFLNATQIYAQCYGVVNFDTAVSANGTSSFDISTTYCNELIMISYDGWSGPGTGPVTVDGNNATQISVSNSGNGTAETYAYFAPLAGTHAIVCTETGYSTLGTTAYDMNFACAFYASGTSNPLTIASLTSAETFTTCNTGGPISESITTTLPNSMIYSNVLYNDGVSSADAITFTGANLLNDYHIGYGIAGADAYTSAAIAATYSVTADNSFPNNTSACGGLSIILVDIPPPLCSTGLSVTTSLVNPTCGNSNGSITLVTNGGVSPYTYSWNPSVSFDSTASGLTAGTYTITVSDGACPPEDTTLVINLTGPVITLTPDIITNENCNGDCIASVSCSIAGGVSPYTYSWTPAGGTTSSANALCAGTYTITITDNNGCSNTSSVSITQPAILSATTISLNALCNGDTGSISVNSAGGTSPYTYSWSPSAQTGITATGLSAGTYSVYITDNNGCTSSASGFINQPPPLTDSITGPLVLCYNGSGTLTASASGGTSPYIYSWNTGAASNTLAITITSTQTYTVNVTDANGCTSSATFTVTLGEPPTIRVSAYATSICNGTSTDLFASATDATGSLVWQPGSMIGPVQSVSPTVTTTYSVTATGMCGTAIGTITIVVNNPPVTAFTAQVNSGCPPLCTQFNDLSTSSSGSIVAWSWSFGNGDTSSIENPIYCYQKPGVYSVDLVTVTDSGCSSTLHTINLIDVYSLPQANFTFSPQPTTILQPTIQFTDVSIDPYGILAWNWNFGSEGDTTGIYGRNPSHTYQDTGTYCVSLTVVNQHGCADSTTNCLRIDPIFTCYVPDAFSPNGDGINDIFTAKGNNIKRFEMYIYDRWESQLYYTNDINKGWNGEVNGNGNVCQEDTYYYLINVTDDKNKLHSFTGELCLLK